MKKIIKEIASLQTGFFAKPSALGDVIYLQSKHFDENGHLLATLHPDLKEDGISEKHLLRNGDVLFAAKGTKTFAAVFETHNKKAVASPSFFVIRQTNIELLPGYLAWLLNSHPTLTLLKSQAIGSSIPSISKHVLENLEIPVPSIQTQKTILAIHQLRIREKALRQAIEILREKQIQQQIINAIT